MASDASLQRMIQHVKKRQEQLEALAPETASKLADLLVAELEERTPGPEKNPLNTGNLKRALTRRTAPYKEGQYFKVGVGDMNLLGGKSDPAPRGTIASFLEDHLSAYNVEKERSRQEAAQLRATQVEAAQQQIDLKKAIAIERRRREQEDAIREAIYRWGIDYADIELKLNALETRFDAIRRRYARVDDLFRYPSKSKRVINSRLKRLRLYRKQAAKVTARHLELRIELFKRWEELNLLLGRIGEELLEVPARRKLKWPRNR